MIAASALLLLLAAASMARAEPSACDDTVRVLRLLSEQYVASRARTEIEAAQTIVQLQKRVEALQAEVEAMRAAAHGEKQ